MEWFPKAHRHLVFCSKPTSYFTFRENHCSVFCDQWLLYFLYLSWVSKAIWIFVTFKFYWKVSHSVWSPRLQYFAHLCFQTSTPLAMTEYGSFFFFAAAFIHLCKWTRFIYSFSCKHAFKLFVVYRVLPLSWRYCFYVLQGIYTNCSLNMYFLFMWATNRLRSAEFLGFIIWLSSSP